MISAYTEMIIFWWSSSSFLRSLNKRVKLKKFHRRLEIRKFESLRGSCLKLSTSWLTVCVSSWLDCWSCVRALQEAFDSSKKRLFFFLFYWRCPALLFGKHIVPAHMRLLVWGSDTTHIHGRIALRCSNNVRPLSPFRMFAFTINIFTFLS